MKNMKKWILVVGLVGQTFLPVSCSGAFTRQIREAFRSTSDRSFLLIN